MAEITLIDLVANGTMDEHMAALLWTVAEEKKSFVSAADPQHAGKTTVASAMLDHIPDGTPVHAMDGTIEQIREFAGKPDGGYLEVGEISDHRPERYIWGEPVQALFETLDTGFRLVTTMHADSAEHVFEQICGDNAIADAHASTIQYVVHILRFGDDMETYWRRIDTVAEIRGVMNGVPDIAVLFRWRESNDSFEALNAPALLAASDSFLAERVRSIRQQADVLRAGATSGD